jgi:tetratricopeptide (TPR) repeat protein
MTSPYVERVSAQIASEPDLLTRSLLRAELGCYWARVGDFDQAEALRADLRKVFGDGRSPRVSIMIMCLEGLLQYFRDLSPSASDRMARARLLSSAIGDKSLVAFSSAWMAHLHFNRNEFIEMRAALDDCLSCVPEKAYPTLWRVSTVVGDAFAYLDDWDTSRGWYSVARDFALKVGDRAAVGALTYNRAALRIFNARLRCISEEIEPTELGLLDAEVRSAINYQQLAELRSLDHLLGSAQVGCLVLQGRHAEAAQLAIQTLEGGTVRQDGAQHALLLADLAVCLAETGRSTEAQERIAQCFALSIATLAEDDQALVTSQLARALHLSGDTKRAEELKRSVTHLLKSHSESVAKIRLSIEHLAVLPEVVGGVPSRN